MDFGDKKVIAIIVIIIIAVVGVAAYMLMPHSYGPGNYIVGKDIPAGTYERTGAAIGVPCGINGDYLIVDDGANVTVESGEIIYINSSTENWWGFNYFLICIILTDNAIIFLIQ